MDKPLRLLDLPPEIWSGIVRLAVTGPEAINITDVATNHVRLQSQFAQPPITRVCNKSGGKSKVRSLPANYLRTPGLERGGRRVVAKGWTSWIGHRSSRGCGLFLRTWLST